MEGDKYPADSDRRRFVKGVVGGAALSGVGTSAAVAVETLTSAPGAGGGLLQYRGVENTDGPAPRAMPQIPVTIETNSNGEEVVKGVWPDNYNKERDVVEMEIAGETYSSAWFQYCGVQTYPGIDPKADKDNTFYYTGGGKYAWQSDAVSQGDPVKVSDFSDYEDWNNGIGSAGLGKPAAATWRSQDVDPTETIPVQIIRSTRVKEMANRSDWVDATTEKGFIAVLNKCTHFCCVPGFKHTEQAAEFDAANRIYCQCHQSVYDPFNVVQRSFTALPRPEEG